MPTIKVVDMSGKEVSTLTLSDKVFGAEVNGAVLHTAVKAYLANQRQGTHSTLTRTEVSGGGKKPWKQKGTGRARQGSTRSPQWTHGGVALGPKPRSYRITITKKTRRTALFSALSSKVADGKMIVVNNIATDAFKTKTMVGMLNAIGADKKALIVTPAVDAKLVKSAANIPGVKTATADSINTYEVLNGGKFVISVDAAKKLEEVFA